MPFFPMTADRRGLVYQIMTAVGFVSLCAVNAVSSSPSRVRLRWTTRDPLPQRRRRVSPAPPRPSTPVRPSQPYGKSISDISNEHPTAITPAGYAFSIWGV